MTDPFAEMHHLVSRGYQQNFAHDHRVTVLDARSGRVVDAARPIKGNFVVAGYNTHVAPDGEPSSRLEREFTNIERTVLDQIRRVSIGRCDLRARTAVIEHFALHLVRSRAFAEASAQVTAGFREEFVQDISGDPEMRRRYEAEIGRTPSRDELATFVNEVFDDNLRANRLHVDSMVRQFNNFARHLARFHVQVIDASTLDGGFALADVPVVHADMRTGRYGLRDQLALGDSDLIIGPLTRHTAAALSIKPRQAVRVTTKRLLRTINAVFIRSALSEIACHPHDARELARLCEQVDRYPAASLVT